MRKEVQEAWMEAQTLRKEGLEEGIKQGIERISQLTLLLMEQNRLDDLECSARDAVYREQLLQELCL